MACEALTGHLRRCSLDNWVYKLGVEVRRGGKEKLCEQIRYSDALALLEGLNTQPLSTSMCLDLLSLHIPFSRWLRIMKRNHLGKVTFQRRAFTVRSLTLAAQWNHLQDF